MSVRRAVVLLAVLSACREPASTPDGGPAVLDEVEATPSVPPHPIAHPPWRFEPGAMPDGLTSLDASECGRCHARHYREWRGSAHQEAFSDPLFQMEIGERQSPFCVACHAPRTERPEEEPQLAADGVDCAACHVRDGRVWSARVSGRAPHASAADPERATVLACAGCHQFDFPGRDGLPMQDTVAEWGRSRHSPHEPCQGCHAPLVAPGHHRHDFPGARDPRLLTSALEIRARATHDGWSTEVELELEATGAGHAVPTGDLFRRLEVRAWIPGREDTERSALLGRVFRVDREGWREVRDERVPPPGGGSRIVPLRLPGRARVVRWSVELWAIPPDTARHAGLDVATVRRHVRSGRVRAR